MQITNLHYIDKLKKLKCAYAAFPWWQRAWFSLWSYNLSSALLAIDLQNPTEEMVAALIKASDAAWFFKSIFGFMERFRKSIANIQAVLGYLPNESELNYAQSPSSLASWRTHPIEHCLPFTVFDKLFTSSDLTHTKSLSLINIPWETTVNRLKELSAEGSEERQRSWYCIAFSQSSPNTEQLTCLARELKIPIQEQLLTSAYLGNMELFNQFSPADKAPIINLLFRAAAERNQISIINKLVELVPTELLNMVKADGYAAFFEAVRNGHCSVINRLAELAPEELGNMIKHNNYFAFSLATSIGHLPIVEKLISLAPDKMPDMVAANNYAAFSGAATNGHLPIVEKLVSLAPEKVPDMVRANNYAAFSEATRYGDLPMVNRLVELVPAEETIDMIKANNYAAFFRATLNNHLPVINRLLGFYPVLAYAEMHEEEYAQYTHPFIADSIANLRSRQQALAAGEVFNLSDDNEVKRCFYIFRNLIRRNDETLLDDMRFLFNIQAVKALLPQNIDGGDPHELLQLAFSHLNIRAVSLLVQALPEDRRRAFNNAVSALNATTNREPDLTTLTHNRESSMTALSAAEQRRLSAAIAHYEPIIGERLGPLFLELLAALETRYMANPAKITKDNGVALPLPLKWADFSALHLSAGQRQKALEAYYQHKDHTALRYLSIPNRWMNPEASYVYINDARTERWSMFETYKRLIVVLWLAAKDDTITPTDGHTLPGRIIHFISELAHLGRAHNWDKRRPRADGHGDEEHDDLTGDRPSCASGVKRRLFQSVIGHPLLSILTDTIIRQEISEFICAKFSMRITDENRASLLDAYTKLVNLDTEDVEPLRLLNITPAERAEFSNDMSRKYGAQFTSDPKLMGLMAELCPEGETDALSCDGLIDLGWLLRPKPSSITPSFFSATPPLTIEEGKDGVTLVLSAT